jgi:hypothetical protein
MFSARPSAQAMLAAVSMRWIQPADRATQDEPGERICDARRLRVSGEMAELFGEHVAVLAGVESAFQHRTSPRGEATQEALELSTVRVCGASLSLEQSEHRRWVRNGEYPIVAARTSLVKLAAS